MAAIPAGSGKTIPRAVSRLAWDLADRTDCRMPLQTVAVAVAAAKLAWRQTSRRDCWIPAFAGWESRRVEQQAQAQRCCWLGLGSSPV